MSTTSTANRPQSLLSRTTWWPGVRSTGASASVGAHQPGRLKRSQTRSALALMMTCCSIRSSLVGTPLRLGRVAAQRGHVFASHCNHKVAVGGTALDRARDSHPAPAAPAPTRTEAPGGHRPWSRLLNSGAEPRARALPDSPLGRDQRAVLLDAHHLAVYPPGESRHPSGREALASALRPGGAQGRVPIGVAQQGQADCG